ncbi:glycosyltransferase [Anaeromyxobacter diazotrophicus]|uniref:Glycosyltransferase 2-like domain-containing protein n=1 Tax=Anaeromyxobacter diazotrophicus TaxID=2590199 RepID=A0A7I9VNH1_9BACT|nr:glycosyltransferase [Anaeromyxobacter diazotrophicus]GEJ57941.1 hypothetical protein AMYX_26820 [Anaeromyxobacter diazotrophicus]
MARISLCLIARNEERMLPDCLASVRGAVDDVVVVDTGSTDRTRELARAAGARVFEEPWRDDFAAPRNTALKHAVGDWILQLDADERLAPGAARAVREAVRGARFDVGMLTLHNAARLDAAAADVLSGRERSGPPRRLPRLLRHAGGLAWRGIIHESVADWFVQRGSKAALIQGGEIVHLGGVPSLREARKKRERNEALLRRRCALEPGDAVAFGYLAAELLEGGDVAGAAQAAERGWAAAAGQPRHLSLQRLACLRAVTALRRADPETALESVRAAEERQGPHPDLHFLRGAALYLRALAAPAGSPERAARAAEAVRAYRAADASRVELPVEPFTDASDGPAALARSADALLLAGCPAEALGAAETALRERSGEPVAQLARAEAVLELGEPARALALLEPLLGELPDGWVLAAGAALALGAGSDAALFLAQARERLPRGFSAAHRLERLERLAAGTARPAAPRTAPPAPPSGAAALAPARRRFAVTVISPPGYAHSAAFHEVAETLVHGLAALGHDAVLTADPSLPGRRHLVLGANLVPATGARLQPGSILYNLEQVDEGSSWITPELLALFRAYPVWDYAAANADALARLGVPRPAVVPVGYVPQLTRIAPAEEDLDVLFYGSLNERRRAVLAELERRGARVHAAFGVYGPARDALVARARLVLNVHYFEAKVFEVVRVSYLLANRRCVVSERGADAAAEAAFEEGVAFAPYEALADRCLALLARPEERRRVAEAGFRLMAARDEAGYLRDVVAALGDG